MAYSTNLIAGFFALRTRKCLAKNEEGYEGGDEHLLDKQNNSHPMEESKLHLILKKKLAVEANKQVVVETKKKLAVETKRRDNW